MNALTDGLTLRLGWTLVHFLWQGAAVAALLWLALRLLRRRSPQSRYAAACAALLLLAAAPAATLWLLPPPSPEPPTAATPTLTPIFVDGQDIAVGLRVDFGGLPVDPRQVHPGHLKVIEHKHPLTGDITDLFEIRPLPDSQAVELRFRPGHGNFGSGNTVTVMAGESLPLRTGVPPEAPWSLTCSTDRPARKELPTPQVDKSRIAAAIAWIEPALPWAVLAWLCGVAAFSLWHAGGWLRVRRLRRAGATLSDADETESAWLAAAKTLASRFRIRGPVRLLRVANLAGPVVIGILRPVILVPAAVLAGLSPEHVEAILAHELAHIRRHDYLVNLLQTLVETLLFYHPAVWWVSGRIRAERELCCDDLAVTAVWHGHLAHASQGHPAPAIHGQDARETHGRDGHATTDARRSYAAALAALAEIAMATRAAAGRDRAARPASAGRLAPAAGTRAQRLLPRIRRVLGLPSAASRSRAGTLAALVVLAGIATAIATFDGNGADAAAPRLPPAASQPANGADTSAGPASRPAETDEQALARLMKILNSKMPKGWEALPIRHGKLSPIGWDEGEGDEIQLAYGLGDKRRKPTVVYIWIMDSNYALKGRKIETPPDLNAPAHQRANPAVHEMAPWRGRRVLAEPLTGNDTWPTMEADVKTAFAVTAGAAATLPTSQTAETIEGGIKFNSRVRFSVFARDENECLIGIGHTPSEKPLDIPRCLWWGVSPQEGANTLDDAVAEAKRQRIPGLYLHGNRRLKDDDLAKLREWPHLVALDLGATSITGAGLSAIARLEELRSLDLSGATGIGDKGLSQIRGLTHLRSLRLPSTGITDVGLADLKDMQELEFLDLGGNGLADEGMAHLAGLNRLRWLFISGNNVTDRGLARIRGLTHLRGLHLGSTKITDEGMAYVRDMKALQWLYLNSEIGEKGLSQLKELKGLRELWLNSSSTTDAGLGHLRELSHLRSLDLTSSRITDKGIEHLAEMRELRELMLEYTDITDAGLEHLKGMKWLRSIGLGRNKATVEGVEELRRALPETVIPPYSPEGWEMSDTAQKLMWAFPSGWIVTGNGPCGAPRGWSGKTKGEIMTYNHGGLDGGRPLRGTTFFMWIVPADYAGRLESSVSHKGSLAKLAWASKDWLVFLGGDLPDNNGQELMKEAFGSLGFKPAETTDVTPAAARRPATDTAQKPVSPPAGSHSRPASVPADSAAAGDQGWGMAVEGVQVRLCPMAARAEISKKLELTADIRNTGDRDLYLPYSYFEAKVEMDGNWYDYIGPSNILRAIHGPYVKSREGISIPLGYEVWRAVARIPGDANVHLGDYLHLTPGRHVFRVGFLALPDKGDPVRIASNPIVLELVESASGTSATTASAPADSAAILLEAVNRVHARVAALRAQHPALEGVASAKPQVDGEPNDARRPIRWGFARNATEWGKAETPAAIDANLPFCRIVLSFYRPAGLPDQPVATGKHYEIAGVKWNGFLLVWTSDANLKAAVHSVFEEELAAATGSPVIAPPIHAPQGAAVTKPFRLLRKPDGKDYYEVQEGDGLWGIATRAYGDGRKWDKIANANQSVDPSHLKAGTLLVIPSLEGAGISASRPALEGNSSGTPSSGPAAGAAIADWEAALLKYPDVRGDIRLAAHVLEESNTWTELRSRLRPDFTFGGGPIDNGDPRFGRDMLWIGTDDNGYPVFRLDRAFAWAAEGQTPRWVVLDFSHWGVPGYHYDANCYREHFSMQSLPAVVKLSKRPPGGDHPTNYAVVKATDPNGGAVYEIGWAPEMAFGTSLTETLRFLYVWRNRAGAWQFIGQGPADSRGHAGGVAYDSTYTTSTVRWEGTPPRPVIVFVTTDHSGVTRVEEDEEDLLPFTESETMSDSILRTAADGSSSRLESSPDHEKYVLAGPGDTLAKIIDRNLGLWGSVGKDKEGRAKRVAEARLELRRNILRLNPRLPGGDIPAGTRIIVSRDEPAGPSPTSAPDSPAGVPAAATSRTARFD